MSSVLAVHRRMVWLPLLSALVALSGLVAAAMPAPWGGVATAACGALPCPSAGGGGLVGVASLGGDAPLTTAYSFTGPVDVAVSALPYLTNDFVVTGTHTVSLPPGATVLRALVYSQSWRGNASASTTLSGTDLGPAAPLQSDAGGLYTLNTYRWDATAVVTGSGSFPFTTTFPDTPLTYLHVLVVVYSHPALPLQAVVINDGGENLENGTSTTTFSHPAMTAGPGRVILVTEADDATGDNESVSFNGVTLLGPGNVLNQNLGLSSSLFIIPVTAQAGTNTLSVTTGVDQIGWHLAILVGPAQPDTIAPEVYYQFDPATRGVQVFGRDEPGGSGLASSGPVPPTTCVPAAGGQTCLYRVSDLGGNSVTVTLQITKSSTQTRVRVLRVQYSGAAATTPLTNETVYSFAPSSGALASLTQCASVTRPPAAGQPSSTQKVCAAWSGGDTTLQFVSPPAPNQSRTGMALLRVATNKGALAIETP